MDPSHPEPTPEALQQALADPRFVPVADALRAAVTAGPTVDVADAVMEALVAENAASTLGDELRDVLAGPPEFDLADLIMGAIEAEAAFAPVGAALRDAVADVPVDLADLVMGALGAEAAAVSAADAAEMEISAWFDGEIAVAERTVVARRMMRDLGARAQVGAYAQLAGNLRDAVRSSPDVWSGVAHAIGADVDDDQGWAEITAALRDAVTAEPVDIAAAVMAGIDTRRTQPVLAPRPAFPRWATVWAPVAAFAAAAAVVFALTPSTVVQPVAPVAPAPLAVAEVADFQLAKVNDAEVEDMEYADGVMGGIIPPQADGEPLVIVVDDSALLAAADVPSGTHL